MGQTLTHGIYLPDEGERNCYNGLAANWQLLDGAVGTVAEHTSQIAGKAPAVHTHTKSDITDFPAYGTTAGTICEGNDSRLSDARTPVAHTHTKSDVTDLLNSNFIPSANNSYDLGSSSYQWNNLYAKNYYYNGVAWGLDKDNFWTGGNIFLAETYNNHVLLTNTTLDLSNGNPALSETNQGIISFTDKNKWQGNVYARLQSWTTSDQTTTVLAATYKPDANTETDFSVWISNRNNDTTFHPYGVPNPNLGNSDHKWKTLNGVNPGALSLPNVNAVTGSSNTQLQDISGDLVQDQYFNCYFTPRMDGWAYIALNCSNATIRSGHSSFSVMVKTAGIFANALYAQSFTKTESAWSNLVILFPVTANKEITLECTFTGFSVTKGYVIPCLGNV